MRRLAKTTAWTLAGVGIALTLDSIIAAITLGIAVGCYALLSYRGDLLK